MHYLISDESDCIRLDKYLINKIDISRSKAQKMIEDSLILVNSKQSKNSYVLKSGDTIDIVGIIDDKTNVEPQDIPLDIIYEDDDLMVINKPSGLVVHPAAGHFKDTLVNGLIKYTNDLSDNNGDLRPGIVHRIDKDTSGLLIIAKNDKAHLDLSNQLKDKTLSRVYVCLVKGRIPQDTIDVDAPIARDISNRKKMSVTSVNSKYAITHFKVLKRYKKATLLEARLETGRTHQIRVHLSYINHPIINDPVYNKDKATSFGQMLHAKEISFIHPTTKKKMTFSCEVPEEFNKILEKYENE